MKSERLLRWRPLALGITALLGLAVRLYGLNWDGVSGVGTNTHPDERQVMYQVIKMAWPSSWAAVKPLTALDIRLCACLLNLPVRLLLVVVVVS